MAGGTAQTAGTSAKPATGDTVTLSPEAKAAVAKLKARDQDVKAHEEAHVAAGGGLVTSGIHYDYEKGPDGQMYAVGGDVSIDMSAVPGNPQATMAKAQQIMAAALAPADPSAQDVAVAGQAASMEAQASVQALAKSNAAQGNGAAQAQGASAGRSASGTVAGNAAGGTASGRPAPGAITGASAPGTAVGQAVPTVGAAPAASIVRGYGQASRATQPGSLFNTVG